MGARENYFCCDGNESHWWDRAFFVGLPMWHLAQNVRVCRGSKPSETKGCVNFVGDFPEFPPDVPEGGAPPVGQRLVVERVEAEVLEPGGCVSHDRAG